MAKLHLGFLLHVTIAAISTGSFVLADEYHYKDILIGERASGLGGAYTAISDDPSGMFYNPAGLVFNFENYFSLSANAFSITSQQFKEIVPGQDYTYKSQSLVPVFFGFTQNFGKQKVGFAIIVPTTDLFDQDDTITNLNEGAGKSNTLKRRFFRQDTSYLIGPAVAREIFENFTIGVSLFAFARFDKTIDNQFIIFNPLAGDDLDNGRWFMQVTHLDRTSYGLYPKLGIQYMPLPKLALGFTTTRALNITGSGFVRQLKTATGTTADGSPTLVTVDGTYGNDWELKESTKVRYRAYTPISMTLGAAYFFSKQFLITSDIDYHIAADSEFKDYTVNSVYNWAIGTEYYLSESLALRVGGFSNNSKTAVVVTTDTNQPPHVNMLGGTLGLSMFRPGSSFSLSFAYSLGSGQGQAISGRPEVQEVKQSNLGLYIAGSYQL